MEFELSEHCDIHELAAAQCGLWLANEVVLGRPEFERPGALREIAIKLAGVEYREDRGRDRGSVITRVVRRGWGDCEDLSSAWHSLLKRMFGRTNDVASLLTHGGLPGKFHAFCRVHGKVFDPSVAGSRVLDLTVRGGMGRPPEAIYFDPRAVVIAA